MHVEKESTICAVGHCAYEEIWSVNQHHFGFAPSLVYAIVQWYILVPDLVYAMDGPGMRFQPQWLTK